MISIDVFVLFFRSCTSVTRGIVSFALGSSFSRVRSSSIPKRTGKLPAQWLIQVESIRELALLKPYNLGGIGPSETNYLRLEKRFDCNRLDICRRSGFGANQPAIPIPQSNAPNLISAS